MPQEGTNDNSAGDLTPWEATRVIIVDDDHRRAQDTQLLLQFVGEPARVIAYADWSQATQDIDAGNEPLLGSTTEHLTLVLLGTCAVRPLAERLQTVGLVRYLASYFGG